MFGTQSIAKCMDRLSTNIHGHHVGAILFIHLTSYSFCMYIQLNYSNMLACLLAHLPACFPSFIHLYIHSYIHSFICDTIQSGKREEENLWWPKRGEEVCLRNVVLIGFFFFFFIHIVLVDKNKWKIEEKRRGKRHFEKKGEQGEKLSFKNSKKSYC